MKAALLGLVLTLTANLAFAAGAHAPWAEKGTFVSAPDGDSVTVATVGRGRVKVRIAGVDTPERGQAYWRAAKAHLVAFVSQPGLTLSCYKTDQYQREVCRVSTPAGDLGASLLSAGLAWHYKRFQEEQPQAEQALYTRLEQRARERKLGLWQDKSPMPPEECRRERRSGGKGRCH